MEEAKGLVRVDCRDRKHIVVPWIVATLQSIAFLIVSVSLECA